jgi:hypothetical protein
MANDDDEKQTARDCSKEMADQYCSDGSTSNTTNPHSETSRRWLNKPHSSKMQDPVVQMQMQELQLKQQEVQLKAQKQQQEAQAKAQQLQIEAARIEAQKKSRPCRSLQTPLHRKDKLTKQMEAEGVRMGIDAAKHRAQMAVQRAQQAAQRQQPRPKKGE